MERLGGASIPLAWRIDASAQRSPMAAASGSATSRCASAESLRSANASARPAKWCAASLDASSVARLNASPVRSATRSRSLKHKAPPKMKRSSAVAVSRTVVSLAAWASVCRLSISAPYCSIPIATARVIGSAILLPVSTAHRIAAFSSGRKEETSSAASRLSSVRARCISWMAMPQWWAAWALRTCCTMSGLVLPRMYARTGSSKRNRRGLLSLAAGEMRDRSSSRRTTRSAPGQVTATASPRSKVRGRAASRESTDRSSSSSRSQVQSMAASRVRCRCSA